MTAEVIDIRTMKPRVPLIELERSYYAALRKFQYEPSPSNAFKMLGAYGAFMAEFCR